MADDLLALVTEQTRAFREAHPAKARASELVDDLYRAARSGPGLSRADRERERAGSELYVRYNALSDVFADFPIDLEEGVFGLLLKIVRASYDLGKLTAPDGVVAREVHRERSSTRFYMLVQAVMAYLDASGLEPKASEKFASRMRPGLLDAMELPKDARAPSLSAIVKALRAIRRQTFDI